MSRRMKHRADCRSVRMVQNQECANCGESLCEECSPVFNGQPFCSECGQVALEAYHRKQALTSSFRRTHENFLFSLGGVA